VEQVRESKDKEKRSKNSVETHHTKRIGLPFWYISAVETSAKFGYRHRFRG